MTDRVRLSALVRPSSPAKLKFHTLFALACLIYLSCHIMESAAAAALTALGVAAPEPGQAGAPEPGQGLPGSGDDATQPRREDGWPGAAGGSDAAETNLIKWRCIDPTHTEPCTRRVCPQLSLYCCLHIYILDVAPSARPLGAFQKRALSVMFSVARAY